jgi:hypothetical protein
LHRTLLLLAALAASATGIWATHGHAAPGSGSIRLPRATPAGQTALWGHAKSLTRAGDRYLLKFDPGLILRGVTAERAAFEDTGSSDVPNDHYVLEESHRLLTFVVYPNAAVTVLTRNTVGGTTRIAVAELAQLVKGRNPRHRDLLEPQTGFWIRIGSAYPNPVLALDQQYQP